MTDVELQKAAREYAESLFTPEDITAEDYKDAVDFHTEIFKDGVNWASLHRFASFEQVDAAAKEYALERVNPDDVDAIEGTFTGGAEWYFVEVTKRWKKKIDTIDGQECYTISERTWYKFMRIMGTLTIRYIIVFLAICAIVVALVMASSYREKNLEQKWQQRQQQQTSQLIINNSGYQA